SWRRLDASISHADDSTSTVGSLGMTGLHRTPAEAANRGAVQQWVSGTNMQYSYRRFRAGMTAYYTRFDADIEPRALLRNRYAFRGNALWNTSLYYNHS